jgi:hypothetical protein
MGASKCKQNEIQQIKFFVFWISQMREMLVKQFRDR